MLITKESCEGLLHCFANTHFKADPIPPVYLAAMAKNFQKDSALSIESLNYTFSLDRIISYLSIYLNVILAESDSSMQNLLEFVVNHHKITFIEKCNFVFDVTNLLSTCDSHRDVSKSIFENFIQLKLQDLFFYERDTDFAFSIITIIQQLNVKYPSTFQNPAHHRILISYVNQFMYQVVVPGMINSYASLRQTDDARVIPYKILKLINQQSSIIPGPDDVGQFIWLPLLVSFSLLLSVALKRIENTQPTALSFILSLLHVVVNSYLSVPSSERVDPDNFVADKVSRLFFDSLRIFVSLLKKRKEKLDYICLNPFSNHDEIDKYFFSLSRKITTLSRLTHLLSPRTSAFVKSDIDITYFVRVFVRLVDLSASQEYTSFASLLTTLLSVFSSAKPLYISDDGWSHIARMLLIADTQTSQNLMQHTSRVVVLLTGRADLVHAKQLIDSMISSLLHAEVVQRQRFSLSFKLVTKLLFDCYEYVHNTTVTSGKKYSALLNSLSSKMQLSALLSELICLLQQRMSMPLRSDSLATLQSLAMGFEQRAYDNYHSMLNMLKSPAEVNLMYLFSCAQSTQLTLSHLTEHCAGLFKDSVVSNDLPIIPSSVPKTILKHRLFNDLRHHVSITPIGPNAASTSSCATSHAETTAVSAVIYDDNLVTVTFTK